MGLNLFVGVPAIAYEQNSFLQERDKRDLNVLQLLKFTTLVIGSIKIL